MVKKMVLMPTIEVKRLHISQPQVKLLVMIMKELMLSMNKMLVIWLLNKTVVQLVVI